MSEQAGRDEPGRDQGFDDAWARIVADYDRGADASDGSDTPRWPVSEDLDPDGDADSDPDRDPDRDAGSDPGRDDHGEAGQPPFVLSVGSPAEARPPGSPDDDGSTRDHWVPPHPPPLPRPSGATGAAWLALAGGPLLLLAATIAGWRLPTLLTAACIIGFVGGLVFLIVQMDGRRRDGWDDGAQV